MCSASSHFLEEYNSGKAKLSRYNSFSLKHNPRLKKNLAWPVFLHVLQFLGAKPWGIINNNILASSWKNIQVYLQPYILVTFNKILCFLLIHKETESSQISYAGNLPNSNWWSTYRHGCNGWFNLPQAIL